MLCNVEECVINLIFIYGSSSWAYYNYDIIQCFRFIEVNLSSSNPSRQFHSSISVTQEICCSKTTGTTFDPVSFSSLQDLNWGGLSVGDLFHRPKANILITIETTDKEINLDLGSKTIPFPLQGVSCFQLP